MRQIKFRAWYVPQEKMVLPDRLESINFDTKTVGVYLLIENKGYNKLRLSDFILMQYTGLFDRNGNEIYEGDILQYGSRPDNRHPVEYRPEMACYTGISTDNGAYLWISKAVVETCEVVGNIYENPDLLEVKEDAQC